MNLAYEHLIPGDFHPNSRVWVYQANRLFTIAEALDIEDLLNEFVANWKSHGAPVKGYANLLFGQFVIFMADESATTVGGCSTDSSVRVVKEIENKFKVNMFDRQLLAFVIKDKIQMLPFSQFQYAFDNKFIDLDTLYFNNLVMNKEQLLNGWMIPVKESWLMTRLEVNQK